MDTKLIDKIYEASFLPELWQKVLSEISDRTGASGGHLITSKGFSLNWTSTDNLTEIITDYISEGWFARCGRRVCVFKDAHAAFLRELDYWSQEEYEENDIYRDFFHPKGWGWSAGTGLLVPTGDSISIFFERRLEEGPLEASQINYLNELRPHLARSVMVATRLGLKNAASAGQALAQLSVPICILSSDGELISSHNMNDDVNELLIVGAKNKLILKDSAANTLLAESLTKLGSRNLNTVQSFPVRDHNEQATYIGHVLPVSRSVHDIFAHSYAILVLIPRSSKAMPSVSLVRSFYDLTEAEARIARGLARGESLDQLAKQAGVAKTTVRTQLSRVMEKTGCSRQGELVSLLNNMTLERSDVG